MGGVGGVKVAESRVNNMQAGGGGGEGKGSTRGRQEAMRSSQGAQERNGDDSLGQGTQPSLGLSG